MLTKREIINEAFAELGLGPYQYDKQPEDYQSALVRLDSLLSEWTASGAAGGYDTGGIDDDSGVPRDAQRGVICALAVDLAPGYGKQPSPSTVTAAHMGRALMMRKSAVVPELRPDYSRVPAGAGYKRPYMVSLPEPDTEVTQDEVFNHGN